MTPLDKPLKRSIEISGVAYTVTINPIGIKLTQKGRRKGVDLSWIDLVNGDAAIAVALQASLASEKKGDKAA